MIILSGDVGGTNTRLELSYSGKSVDVIFSKNYLASKFRNLTSIIETFFNESGINRKEVFSCCIAVAGPIKNGSIEFTNLPWEISEKTLSEFLQIGIDKVKLINDFEAAGYGIKSINEKDLVTIQDATKDPSGLIATIGAGTGLGMGIITHVNEKFRVYPTEGGHQDFAPIDDDQIQLLQFLKKRLHRVSIERLCCGSGLFYIYKYVSQSSYYRHLQSISLKRDMYISKTDPAQLIVHYAKVENDMLALKVIDIFIRIYGAVVGNLALSTLPKQGIYIMGGLSPRLVDFIKKGTFMKVFLDKGRMSELIRSIPVFVVMDTNIGLKGATIYAKSLL